MKKYWGSLESVNLTLLDYTYRQPCSSRNIFLSCGNLGKVVELQMCLEWLECARNAKAQSEASLVWRADHVV
jgi:hypothetical protein